MQGTAFPGDSDRLLLMDLLSPTSQPTNINQDNLSNHSSDLVTSSSTVVAPEQVHVRRVTQFISDSSSDESSSCCARSSPPPSSRHDESDFARSESLRSSVRSTSAVVTDAMSHVSDVSTAPPSLQNSPALRDVSEKQMRQTQSRFASDLSPYPTRKSPTPRPRRHAPPVPDQQVPAAVTSPSRAAFARAPPIKSDSKSSADSAIENPSLFSSGQLASTPSLSDDVTVIPFSRQSSNQSAKNHKVYPIFPNFPPNF